MCSSVLKELEFSGVRWCWRRLCLTGKTTHLHLVLGFGVPVLGFECKRRKPLAAHDERESIVRRGLLERDVTCVIASGRRRPMVPRIQDVRRA